MSKYHDAADTLKRAALKYEQLMSAAAALEEIGSLDQAAAEAKAAAEKSGKERDAIIEAKAKAQKELDKIHTQADEAVKAAQASTVKIIGDAERQAQQITDKAAADARAHKERVVEEAQAEANRIAAITAKLMGDRDDMLAQAKAANKARDEATTAADSAEKRLASIKEAIAKLATA